MKFIRFKTDSLAEMKGIVDGDGIIRLHGSFFQNYTVTDEKYPLATVTPLPPVLPRTIACFGTGAEYIKSPASLSAGGKITAPSGQIIYCVPRLGFVLTKSGSVDIFGIMPVLDFITERDCGGIGASRPGYTAVGPLLYTSPVAYSYKPEFTLNGKVYSFTPDYEAMVRELPEIMQMDLVTGDILAFGLGACFECGAGDELKIMFTELPLLVNVV